MSYKKLDIPLFEISEETLLQEHTQVGKFDPLTRRVRVEKPQKGQRLARLSRRVEGIPVFSSSVLLGLTKDEQIGFLELHWPEIPKHVVTEAHRLQFKVQHGWRPPEQKGATVESVEAGIVHSAPVGFLMDIYPAIRVIYAPVDKRIGRKLVLYLNRDGKPIPFPRQFDLPAEKIREREKR